MMRCSSVPTHPPPSDELDPRLKLLLLQEALEALVDATTFLKQEAQRQHEEDLVHGPS